MFASSLEDKVASAVERIYTALVNVESVVTDPAEAGAALKLYCVALREIADAAAADNDAEGLSEVCGRMAEQMEELCRRESSLSLATHAFLMEWPDLLIGYMSNPGDAASAEALLRHLQDPLWPSPMQSQEAPALLRRLQCRAEAAPRSLPDCEGDGQSALLRQEVGADETPAQQGGRAKYALLAAADGGTASEESDIGGPFDAVTDFPEQAAEVSNAIDEVASGAAAMDEVSGIFVLAEQQGLLGLQEVCMRVLQNVSLFAEAELRPGTPVGAMLERFPQLAHEYMASRHDPRAADLLTDYLSADPWPEPLAADERESLQAILLADGGEPASPDSSLDQAPAAVHAPMAQARPADEGAFLDEPIEPRPQTVNDELIGMLGAELAGMRADLDLLLQATEVSEPPSGKSGDAVEAYVDLIQRLEMAAEAIGLVALKSFLVSLHRRLGAAGLTAAQREVLAMLPGSILAYLAAPSDPSTCEGLLDLMRGDTWARPLSPTHAESLLRALCMVEVTRDTVGVEARQIEALPENVSLALPGDLSQELLDGLLQEMPLLTGEFSAAIQHIAAGNGTLKDVDAAKRAAHTLKGAANTVGIKGIANLTHHVEDILVALSKYQTLPGRKMAGMLTNAGDCLEAMGEAVLGTGPEPDYALNVLQNVLDWANRIDREGVPEDDTPVESRERAETTPRASSGNDAESAVAQSGQPSEAMIRVPASLVDELLRLVGETIISTGQVRERLQRLLRQNKSIREQNSVFLQLATELEEMVDLRGAAEGFTAARDDDEFDPLEFEHYGELHTVSRRLIEAATDTRELSAEVEGELSSLGELVDVQNLLHEQSQNAVMRTRMVPVATVVSRLQRSVRQAGRLLDKRVDLNVVGADTMIDSNILNELVDPIMHMLRNAVDHGIEPLEQRAAAGKDVEGRIELAFSREGNQIVVRCRDDGAGLNLAAVRRTAENKGLLASDQTLSDDELARLILAPGFSTRTESTQMSGRGVGMDVVYSRVLQLKGGLNLNSVPGKGLEIELHLPAMLISTHALLVRSRARVFAISSYGIQDIRYVTLDQIQKIGGDSFFRINEELLPIADLEDLLGLRDERRGDERKDGFPAFLVREDSGAVHAVRVQEIIDSGSLVVKSLGRYVPKPPGVVGATILGDGSVAAVIDVPDLMRKSVRRASGQEPVDAQAVRSDHAPAVQSRLTAMVVDDSLSARRATAQFMKDAGFEVRSAIDGLEAVSILDKWKPSILLVDMEMPRMNGLELTAHVRARPDTAKIPVIMITSRSTEKHRHQAEAAGVNVYLTKPFGDDELLRHVTELTGMTLSHPEI
ncbi:MAG: response regulator [Sulfuritalea sp.]|nr:response regulator [Sulfuritalea sp.]